MNSRSENTQRRFLKAISLPRLRVAMLAGAGLLSGGLWLLAACGNSETTQLGSEAENQANATTQLQPAPQTLTMPAWPGQLSGAAPSEGSVLADASREAQNDTPAAERVSVMVYLTVGADRGPVRAFAGAQGGFVRYEYKTVLPNVMNLRNIPGAAVEALRNIPGVDKVEEDQYYDNLLKLDESTPRIRALQSLMNDAGFTEDGTGVRVCVCDTGIDTDHLMYADRIDFAASHDFANNDSNPEDDHGHGAHVSGIAVGGTGLSVTFNASCDGTEPFQGVAPGATLIGVKILNQNGGGSDSDIVAGIDHCADPALPGGQADVINLSIGTGQFSGACDSHVWAVAANNAVDAGVTVVAASGNDGFPNALASPACASKVISVGATYKADYPRCEDTTSSFTWCLDFFCFDRCTDDMPTGDTLVCFSNQSDNLDVSAPGSIIWSASTASGGATVTQMSGTSMASPQVAGLAALIIDADPTLTPAQVRQLIRDGALDFGPTGFDRGYGHGRIDVINSLSLIQPEVCPNGTCGGGEDQCSCAADCGTPPGTETNCTDGIDNDCDVAVDCDDTDCDGDPACICDNDGVCEVGEDCNNCSNDCASGSGATCGNSICEAGDGEDCVSCPADCNGVQNGRPSGRFCCGGGGGQNPVDCSDNRCTSGGFSCTDTPVVGSCCGDGTCEGAEDVNTCAIDCAVTCNVPEDCDDLDACTTDDCTGGTCSNTPVDCNDNDACTADSCDPGTGACLNTAISCDDGDACTADSCDPVTGCENTFPVCGLVGDGCCGPDCNAANDADCLDCVAKHGPCGTNDQCCSGMCKRNGTCR